MTQMNILPVDLNQPAENKGLFSSAELGKDDGFSRDNTHDFASYLVEKPSTKNGNTRQENARDEKVAVVGQADSDEQKNATTSSADSAEVNDGKSKANTDTTRREINDATEKAKTQASVNDNKRGEVDVELQHTLLATEHGNEEQLKAADAAIKLLDFITASEITSTARSKTQSIDAQVQPLLSEDIATKQTNEAFKDIAAQDANAADSSQDGELAAKEQKLALEIQAILSSKSSKASSEDEGQLKAKSADVIAAELVDKVAVDASESDEASGKKQDIALVKTDNTSIAPEKSSNKSINVIGDTHAKTATELDSLASELTIVEQDENLQSVANTTATQLTDNTGLTAKQNLESISTSQDKEKVKNSAESIVQNNKDMPLQVNVENAEETVSSKTQTTVIGDISQKVDSKDTGARVVNQATANVVKTDVSAEQQSSEQHAEQQQSEQEASKENLISKHQQSQDVTKQAVVDSKQERQSIVAEPTTATTSINSEQEHALHSTLAKAHADSMSVQSTKTAQVIAQETIAINRKDFSVAVKEKVMVMINQKLKQLDIRLDPPELGSMQVKINMQNEQAAVNFVVQNPQARDALEQHMGKLKDMLAQSGVDVGDANIEQRDQNQETGEQLSGSNGQSTNSDEESLINENHVAVESKLYKASSTGVDYYA